jgi:transposase
VVCVDELGPVSPRTFPPAPGWSPDGHRIKAPLEYSRGPDKVWVFGALRVEDGKTLTFTSRSRNSKGYLKLLKKIERTIPRGLICLIADNLKIHDSALVRKWLEEHPRIEHAFIPKGAAWLNLIEGWWRIFRRQAFAGQCFADSYESRHPAAKPQSQSLGLGSSSQTAEVSEAYVCVPPLRNGALVLQRHFHVR